MPSKIKNIFESETENKKTAEIKNTSQKRGLWSRAGQ